MRLGLSGKGSIVSGRDAANKLIGQLILTSEVLASSYGDERLNFQHNMEK